MTASPAPAAEDLKRLLSHAAPLLPAEDYAVLELTVACLTAVTALLHQQGTTLARLRRLFGAGSSEKAEKILPPPAPAEGAPTEPAPPPGTEASAEAKPKRKGHGRIPSEDYPGATQEKVEHPTLSAGDACPACTKGTLYALDPAEVLRILGQAMLTAKLWLLERLRCSACGVVFTAPAPAAAQGPKFDEAAVAMMALLHYDNGQPFHRLERLQRYLGVPVPATTQWRFVNEAAKELAPVLEELRRLAAQSPLLHVDDTYLRLLAFMGKRRAKLLAKGELDDPERTGLFTTGVVAKTAEQEQILLYCSGRKHAGENLADLLAQRMQNLPPPILMSDALERNLPKGHPVVDSNCLCHGRRNVVDQVGNFPAECRFLITELGKVFKIDDRCRAEQLSDEERLRVHQAESAPTMQRIWAWARDLLDQHKVEPNSDMGKALNYLLNHWQALTRFLHVAGAPLENNICERALKMAIRHRKNSLFYKTERGAEVGDLFMSLIETAVANGENPLEYLTELLRHSRAVAEQPEDWLPWTFRDTLARLDAPKRRLAA
jgi:transposase